jgi:hypothetical protein
MQAGNDSFDLGQKESPTLTILVALVSNNYDYGRSVLHWWRLTEWGISGRRLFKFGFVTSKADYAYRVIRSQ